MAEIRANATMTMYTNSAVTSGRGGGTATSAYSVAQYYSTSQFTNVLQQAYLQFDISEILRKKITKVVLNQTLNYASVNGINCMCRVFYLLDIKNLRNYQNLLNYNDGVAKYVEFGANISSMNFIGTGFRQNDITTAFDKNLSQEGLIGLELKYVGGDFPDANNANLQNPYLTITVDNLTSLPPVNLLPNTTKNPKTAIAFSWQHNPNTELILSDPQVGSELTIWQDGVTPIIITQSNASNAYTLPANTFTQYKTVYFRVRTQTQYNGWGELAQSSFPLAIQAPLAPTNLLPTTTQNPRGVISFSWWHNPNPEMPTDTQIASELTVWQDGVTPNVFTISGAINNYDLTANTFTAYNRVYFKVRTQTQINGWGEFAATVSFPLGATPPLAPTLVFPLNISINGTNGVPLEWRYNSPHDTTPTRFDIRYNQDGGAWINKSNAGQLSIMTNPIITQDKVTWQVMAYGALGDAGPWSDLGTFFTIGIPDTPIIVRVSNSNRPTIYFSALDLMSWELEIMQGNIAIYLTGSQAFLGDFLHKVNQFLSNGNYIARMRITNEYGLNSDWGTLPFTINTIAPQALKLYIVDNPRFNTRLHFNNNGELVVYIYRSELRKNNFLRIAMTKNNTFDDFTARPKTRYEYFVRVVTPENSFADSNIVTGSLNFLETTIAEYNKPNKMLMFLYAIDGKPTKDESYDFEMSFTNFVGREKPVLQMGEHSSLSQSYSFFCTLQEYEKLKNFKKSANILILRDWRLGSVYGKINGTISASGDLGGMNVSFTFTEIDFNEEVDLI